MISGEDPAFPAPEASRDAFGDARVYPGMSLRDYFAAQVIGHLVCAPMRQELTTELDANYAYKVADAMLTARIQK